MMAWAALFLFTMQLSDAFVSDNTATPVTDIGQNRGVAWSDLDRDGRPDLVVAGMGGSGGVRVYRNRPSGLLRVRPDVTATRIDAEGIASLDIDRDGLPELLVARTDGPPLLFRNLGNFRFEVDRQAFSEVAVPSSMICLADFDRGGLLDALVVTRGANDDLVFRNDKGRLRLVDGALRDAPGDGRSCAVGYLDGDALPDIYVGDFIVPESRPPINATDRLFRNIGGFRFERQDASPAANSPSRTYGASFFDWDEDGDDDLFVTNIARTDRNMLYENERGTLRPRPDLAPSLTATGPSKGHTWGDFDNDGDADLYIAEGTEGLTPELRPFDLRNALFEQRERRLFPITAGPAVEEEHISAGTAHADFDSDGDLDLFVANWGGTGEVSSLYLNRSGGRSLSIALEGTRSNSQGIGARLWLWVRRGQNTIVRRASLWPQSGYGSMNEPVVHFGLRPGDWPLRLRIDWPSGRRQHFSVNADVRYVAREGGSIRRR